MPISGFSYISTGSTSAEIDWLQKVEIGGQEQSRGEFWFFLLHLPLTLLLPPPPEIGRGIPKSLFWDRGLVGIIFDSLEVVTSGSVFVHEVYGGTQ